MNKPMNKRVKLQREDIEPIELQVQGSSEIVAGCEAIARCADFLVADTEK